MDPLALALCLAILIAAPLGAWAAVRHDLDPTPGHRLARYLLIVVAVVAGFGLGQAVAGQLPGHLPEAWVGLWASLGMLAMLACAFIGVFAAMALVQVVEYPLRRQHGLPPMPYRLVRFDLLRW